MNSCWAGVQISSARSCGVSHRTFGPASCQLGARQEDLGAFLRVLEDALIQQLWQLHP